MKVRLELTVVLTETSLLFLCKFLLISREVSIETRSTPALLSFKGQASKHTTAKNIMVHCFLVRVGMSSCGCVAGHFVPLG